MLQWRKKVIVSIFSFFKGIKTGKYVTKCPGCRLRGPIFLPSGPNKEGIFEVRGKMPSGHIVLHCHECKKNFKWDTLTGKTKFIKK